MNKSNHFASLDGYRGIAAICVATLHAVQHIPNMGFVNNFELAVDFFFILSGFVIAFTYESKIISKKLSLIEFVKKRMVRLYPMMLIGALFGIAWRLFEGRFGLLEIIGAGFFSILMLPLPRSNAEGGNSYPINGPGWSVSHEVLVNILFAGFARWLKGGWLWCVFIVIATIEVMMAFHSGHLGWATSWSDQPAAFIRALTQFLLGVAIFRTNIHLRMLSKNCWPVIGMIILICALVLPVAGVFYSLVCVFVVFPFLILLGCASPKSVRMHMVFDSLGKISFPLYAVNEPIARWFGYWYSKINIDGRWGALSFVFFEVVLIIFVSFVIFVIYDRPVRAWLGGACK